MKRQAGKSIKTDTDDTHKLLQQNNLTKVFFNEFRITESRKERKCKARQTVEQLVELAGSSLGSYRHHIMRWTCPYAHPGQKFCSLTTNTAWVCVRGCVWARVRTLCHGQQLFYKKRIIIFTGYKNFLVGVSVVPSDRRPATDFAMGVCVCVRVSVCMHVCKFVYVSLITWPAAQHLNVLLL